MSKRVLGISIDKTQVYAALLSKTKQGTVIEALESFELVEPLEPLAEQEGEQQVESQQTEPDEIDPFVAKDTEAEEQETEDLSDAEMNDQIVYEIIQTLCPKGTGVAFNLQEPHTINRRIEINNPGKVNVKKTIYAELTEAGHQNIESANIRYLNNSDNSYAVIGHDDPLLFSDLFFSMGDQVRTRNLRISLIDALEFSLVPEITRVFSAEDLGHSAVLYFSDTFTKIILIKDGEIERILPIIAEGSDSDQVCNLALSRIMFEVDAGRVEPLDSMVLCGEIERQNAYKFFKREMDVNVLRYMPLDSDFSDVFEGYKARSTLFVAAIALAQKALGLRSIEYSTTNFMPQRIKDRQSLFKLTWSSVLFLVLLFLGALYITAQILGTRIDIRREQYDIRNLDTQLAAMANTAAEVDSLRQEIINLEKGTALIDSLTQRSVVWSVPFLRLSEAYAEIGDFSVVNFTNTQKDRLLLDLELTEPDNVVKLERFMENSILKSIIEHESGKFISVEMQVNLTPGVVKEP